MTGAPGTPSLTVLPHQAQTILNIEFLSFARWQKKGRGPSRAGPEALEPKPGTDINDLIRNSDDPKNALASLLAAASRLLPGNTPPTKPKPEPSQEAPTEEPAATDPGESGFAVTNEGRQAELAREGRAYRVRGLEQNTSFDHLKVNIRMGARDRFHIDTFDLYNARQRSQFVAAAAQITGSEAAAIEADFGVLIGHLEAHQEKKILEKMKAGGTAPEVALSMEEERAALDVLRHPRLLDLVLADIHKCGLVGDGQAFQYIEATKQDVERVDVLLSHPIKLGKEQLIYTDYEKHIGFYCHSWNLFIRYIGW